MLNRNAVPALKNDRRVEALLRQEMAEHQSVISSHHKEMQVLRDSLKLAMDRFDSLYEKSSSDLKLLEICSHQHIEILNQKVTANEKLIADQKQTILSLYQQLHDFPINYTSKAEVEKIKKDMDSIVKDSSTMHISSFQKFQQELKVLYVSLKEDLINLRGMTEQKLCALNERLESKFSVSKLEKDAVLKEIRIYDKSQFIIEKKIENIYTLIERINQRGEVCHKPES